MSEIFRAAKRLAQSEKREGDADERSQAKKDKREEGEKRKKMELALKALDRLRYKLRPLFREFEKNGWRVELTSRIDKVYSRTVFHFESISYLPHDDCVSSGVLGLSINIVKDGRRFKKDVYIESVDGYEGILRLLGHEVRFNYGLDLNGIVAKVRSNAIYFLKELELSENTEIGLSIDVDYWE
jgi:hypothetical protein